ncbi:hypothetical protein LJR290_007461 [Variovorax sp. LjRoot290]|uniref:hypothetical protein n=1 Tax=Variovorax sp. LjRoot290 TaxID=3342316 RepID=UPI003ECE07FA
MAERGGSIDALRKAVEFAHYLAKDAEELLEAVNERDALLVKIEEGEEIDEATLQQANEAVLEFTRGLRSGIHEFRKRADRLAPDADASAPPAAAPTPVVAAASEPPAPTGLREVPDYVPATQQGEGLVTYWLWYGDECVGSKRMPMGTGAVDVRNAAANEAVIFCDRANGEIPSERRNQIFHATVRVYDDLAVQEQMRRERPFEGRGLFPNELPFLELTFRSPLAGAGAAAHIGDVTVGLQDVAFGEGLELSAWPRDDSQRLVRIESADREALGRAEVAMKACLVERDAELVAEFGVGYVRSEGLVHSEPEPETERPRG